MATLKIRIEPESKLLERAAEAWKAAEAGGDLPADESLAFPFLGFDAQRARTRAPRNSESLDRPSANEHA